MTAKQRETVLAYADGNMSYAEAGRRLYCDQSTVVYRLKRIKADTGLDPCNFYDLVELVKRAKEEQGRRDNGQWS